MMIGLFARLKLYTVHVQPTHAGDIDKIEFVPEGFSFMAFVFVVFWALYHRLWLPALALIVANLAIIFIATAIQLDDIGAMISQLALQIWFGFHARDMLRARLKRSGYMTSALVSGESQMRAEQRFYDQHAAQFS